MYRNVSLGFDTGDTPKWKKTLKDSSSQKHQQKDLFVTANERDLYNSITWKKPQNLGVFYGKILEAFTHRITFIRATLYPFFGVYLNMPGHSYNAIFSVFSMFWSLKIFWAFIIDAKVILGKARIYYMAMGSYSLNFWIKDSRE